MKKLFLTLVLVLTVSFAFATNGEKKITLSNFESDIISTKIIDSNLYGVNYVVIELKVINQDLSCSILHVVKRKDGSTMGTFVVFAPDGHEDCGGVVFHLLKF